MTQILIADDEASIRTILSRAMEQKGFDVVRARTGREALEYLQNGSIDVALIDIRMPEMTGLEILNHQREFPSQPLIFVITAQDTMENAVEAMKRGAYDYLTKPFDLEELALLVDRALETRRLQRENQFLKHQRPGKVSTSYTLIGRSKPIQEVYKTIGKVANQDATVLIHGESGTGKELVAKAIHFNGNRAQSPFVAVNCSAIPRELLESELFGYKKGAFTGAIRDKTGYFSEAHLGTLFLDEIADLPLSLQAKLLRVLQEKEIQKVGDTKTTPINVRIIAATNKTLSEQVKKGAFREDLYFRLNVVPITLPPLRERKNDIPILVDFFLEQNETDSFKGTKHLSHEALSLLQKYDWPGNVRELENLIKRACVLTQGQILEKRDIETLINLNLSASSWAEDFSDRSLEEMITYKLKESSSKLLSADEKDLLIKILPSLERPLVRLVLERTGWNQIKAAQILGINRNTLRKKIKDLKIKHD